MPHLRHDIEAAKLIQTKLYRPQVNADLIDRPHLLVRLDAGLNHKLILMSAPPGFGKTTLVSQWLAACQQPTAWLSLDENDNHLPQFLRYVCAAICRRVPEACNTLQSVVAAVNLPGMDDLVDLLIEELNALPGTLILVLDDYHRIHSRDVHESMRRLLRYLPPQLHLVILTRADPPLNLGRLRLGQHITEIRAADLQFTLAETHRFLQAQTGRPLDDEVLQALQMRTEGWVIGLQLAGISLQSQTPYQVLARFSGNHRLLAGYLVEEVTADLPEEVAAFLTRSALVERFCAPLGDALLVDSPWAASSQTIIARLEAQNLFVIPLDDEGTWYRYHDLFRDFLLHRLKNEQRPDVLAKLHQRAGDWLT
jgi:LuxR family transcriptional regulator, maltose regulon positive regulatory protein